MKLNKYVCIRFTQIEKCNAICISLLKSDVLNLGDKVLLHKTIGDFNRYGNPFALFNYVRKF